MSEEFGVLSGFASWRFEGVGGSVGVELMMCVGILF